MILFIFFLQPETGCKKNMNTKINQNPKTSLPSTVVLFNQQSEPLVVWFSKDSLPLHYFYGAFRSSVSIMHVVQDGSYTSNYPLFVVPYTNFVKVVYPGDSLIIISKDSTIRNDIHISYCSSLGFMNEKVLSTLKQLAYQENVVLIGDLDGQDKTQ